MALKLSTLHRVRYLYATGVSISGHKQQLAGPDSQCHVIQLPCKYRCRSQGTGDGAGSLPEEVIDIPAWLGPGWDACFLWLLLRMQSASVLCLGAGVCCPLPSAQGPSRGRVLYASALKRLAMTEVGRVRRLPYTGVLSGPLGPSNNPKHLRAWDSSSEPGMQLS